MNAYELADELRKMFQGEEYDRLIHEIPDVLCQQADRIAELEKDGKVCATCGGLVYDPVIKQTKPLSDEEILQFRDEVPYSYSKDLLDFARAIEERHGIK